MVTAEGAKYLTVPTGPKNRVVSDIYARFVVSDVGDGDCNDRLNV